MYLTTTLNKGKLSCLQNSFYICSYQIQKQHNNHMGRKKARRTEDEYIVFKVDTEEVSVTDLCSYLSNINSLISSINQTLNKDFACGVDQVKVDVLALENGSFEIPLKIKKIMYSPSAIAPFGPVLSQLIAMAMNEKAKDLTINCIEDQAIMIGREDLFNNNKTRRCVSNIAKTATNDSNLKALQFNYKNEKGRKLETAISKAKLLPLVQDDIDTYEPEIFIKTVTLTIVSPVLKDEQATWRFFYDGRLDGQTITAKMKDPQFLKKLGTQTVAFGSGDKLKVDLRTIADNSGETTRERFEIVKVHHYPHYRKQEAIQGSLF